MTHPELSGGGPPTAAGGATAGWGAVSMTAPAPNPLTNVTAEAREPGAGLGLRAAVTPAGGEGVPPSSPPVPHK